MNEELSKETIEFIKIMDLNSEKDLDKLVELVKTQRPIELGQIG